MLIRIAPILLLLAQSLAFGQATPVGLWKTIDDSTNQEKSLVRIDDHAGVLDGRIERLLDPNAPAGGVCLPCTDDRKGQPLVGLVILREIRHDPDDAAVWNGGDILDPGNGKVYRVRLKLEAGGQRLNVRGYIGTPLLGRTQTWIRVP